MFKDFLYLCFIVRIDGVDKYFINYKRALDYKNQSKSAAVEFNGLHLINGWECFSICIAFEVVDKSLELQRCSEYFAGAEL